ncbi:MAG: long-chain fatty acid--CoA ligase [Pseudomonadota bacterium]
MSELDATPEKTLRWLEQYPSGVDWHRSFEEKPAYALLEDSAQRAPDAPYLDFFGRAWSYGEASDLVNKAAAGFQALGVKPGVHVGLFLPNCPQFIFCFYGILKAGGTVVNFSPLYSVEELVAQVEDAKVDIMVTLDVAMLYEKIHEVMDQSRLRQLIVGSLAEVLPFPKNMLYKVFKRREASDVPFNAAHISFHQLTDNDGMVKPVEIDPAEDIAVLQYTGGTTGTPKGAMLSHANLYTNALQTAHYEPDIKFNEETMLGALPLFHVFAMTVVMNVSTYMGAKIVLLPKFDLDQVMRTIGKSKVTLMPGVPTMYMAMLNHTRLERYDLGSLRLSLSGGAPLPVELKSKFEQVSGAILREGYGLTETSGVVSANPFQADGKTGSVGLPVPGTEILICDPEDTSKVLEQGERGEICVVGPQVMRGYWNKPDATAATLAGGRLRTGDIGYTDEDGYTFIVDRMKDLILVSGFNVFPRRIEEALYAHPSVREAVAIGIPDAYRGESPKAFVTLVDGVDTTETELLEFIRPKLSKVEIPVALEIRAELPKTMVGKLSKKELVAEEQAKYESTEPQV